MKIRFKDLTLDLEKRVLYREDKKSFLNSTEFYLLLYIIKNPYKVISRNEIMNYVWENEKYIDDNRINVAISRLRKKVDSSYDTKYIRTSYGTGYYLSDKQITN